MVITLFFAIPNPLMAQVEVGNGEWLLHLSYQKPTQCLEAFNRIYTLASGNLYYYNPQDNSVFLYSKENILNDNDIACMAYCSTQKAIVVAYGNGNIDLLYRDNSIYNITDLKNSSMPDKRANSIYVNGDAAYLSLNGALLVLDVKKGEIKDCYNLNRTILSSITIGENIYCSTPQGIFTAKLTDNLKDASVWTLFHKLKTTKLFIRNGQLAAYTTDKQLRTINSSSTTLLLANDVTDCFGTPTGIIAAKENGMTILSNDVSTTLQTDIKTITAATCSSNGDVWLCSEKGLGKYKIKDGSLTCTLSPFNPQSPASNIFCVQKFVGNTLYALASNMNNIYLENRETQPGEIMAYSNGIWSCFNTSNIADETGMDFLNATCIAADPADNGHFYVGTARRGLYEFNNGSFSKYHSFTNSPLATILPGNQNPQMFVSVTGLQYDSKGNLWMFNNECDTIIRIIQPGGKWTNLYYEQIKGLPTFGEFLFYDQNLVLANSTRYKPGVFIIDTKGSLDPKQHETYFLGPVFTNQEGNSETVNAVFFIEKDLDGTVWIGTDNGIFTIDNVNALLKNRNGSVKRIKVPRNDGSNLADYLFTNVYTTSIAIDAANRKWIGTQNNGLFLIDSDNITTLHHFNTDNSPLPSDNIESIAIDRDNGHVYIGTRQGLVVYGGDATAPSDRLLMNGIGVYPNPVSGDFDGNVSVTGLTEGCSISIVSSSGLCVNSGHSNGGMYSWDCAFPNGNRVPGGVYTIIARSGNGTVKTAKLTIIR